MMLLAVVILDPDTPARLRRRRTEKFMKMGLQPVEHALVGPVGLPEKRDILRELGIEHVRPIGSAVMHEGRLYDTRLYEDPDNIDAAHFARVPLRWSFGEKRNMLNTI